VAGAEQAFPDLDTYHTAHPGLTEKIGAYYAEAARVCLDRHHQPPQSVDISGDDTMTQSYLMEWSPPTTKECNAWGNSIDATEDASYCLALAAAHVHLGLAAIRRAPEFSGSDYYLGPVDTAEEPADGELSLENAIRLEVSGIDRCNDALLLKRLREKIDQAKRGRSNLPALAVVVGFSMLRIAFRVAV
jgi:hypothetical protein